MFAALGLIAAVSTACGNAPAGSTSEVTIVYEVTGDAKNVTVSYSTFGGGSATTNQEQVATLPWKKEAKANGLGKGGLLTAVVGSEGGSVNCKVTADGKEMKTATSTGPLSSASCAGW